MTKLTILAAVGFALSAGGCSTIVNGTNQGVTFTTADASGNSMEATCTATGGSEFALNETFTTPVEVQIPRSKKPIDITCRRDGMVGTRTIKGKVEGSTAGNIIAGGGIGVGVDALTGAIYKYPKTVLITMRRAGEAVGDAMDSMSSAEPMMK